MGVKKGNIPWNKGYDGDEAVFAAKCEAAERYCEENDMQYRIVRY